MITYQGLGGVDGVLAGSRHLFTLSDGKNIERILHDSGSKMEGDNHQLNRKKLPFSARELLAMVLSHGHYDHNGEVYWPYLNQFNGYCFAHPAAVSLTRLMLDQLVSSEMNRVSNYNRQIAGRVDSKTEKFIPFIRPQIEPRHARHIKEKFESLKYGITVQVPKTKNIKLTFYDAGHIIGSSQVLYEFTDPQTNKTTKLLTCVDLGRSDIEVPLLNKPYIDFPEDIDHCIIESTYGNREHTDREESFLQLEETLLRGMRDKKRMLIGAFSIMRTHSVLSDLFAIYKRGKLPADFKIYLDSPTALDVNRIILENSDCLNPIAQRDFFDDSKETPFKFPNLQIVYKKDRSTMLDNTPGPYAIISASGMWFMGRIVQHLKNHISDKNAMLIQTGYQVPSCIGFQIQEGKEKFQKIKIEGQDYDYNAELVRLRGYSAHADGKDCVNHVLSYVKPKKSIFVVHGDRQQLDWTVAEFARRGKKAQAVIKNKPYDLS